MKVNTSLLVLIVLLSGWSIQAQTSKDFTVQARVVVSKSPASISIRWPLIPTGVTTYNIYRRAKDALAWGAIKGTVNGTDTMWTDTDVTVGTVYEYNVQKLNGNSITGRTYILSGIDVPVVHNRGSVLVVVEKKLAAAITSELNIYLMDIVADGWKVFTVQVSDTDSVSFVRKEIRRIEKIAGGLKALLLIGHVPVPYSGNFAPDGHGDHAGCWPTDAYYAIDSDNWTDTENNPTPGRMENKNLPGDGKFDEVEFPADVRYYTGRVDLSNMPKFSLSEADLTKRYFKKAHDFRYKFTQTVEKGVIDENFDVSYGAFSSTGWRNFSVMFGPKNIIEGDMLTNCKTDNLLFSYGAGGGSYTSCGGVCVTDDFITGKAAVFNMIFGSYFGDWDIANNLLRAPLAAPENGLTNAWSGRPYWQNHPMALGEPVGYCAMITQNNKGTYVFNIFANTVTIGLMGDPTLRLHMIAPPTQVVVSSQSNNTKADLSWTASPETGIAGYYIYRASNPYGNYYPINSIPHTGTTFTDNTPFQGTNYYHVKTVKLTTSASGTYFNTSQGISVWIHGMTGQPAGFSQLSHQKAIVYPNPAKEEITIQLAHFANDLDIEFYNVRGEKVKSVAAVLNSDLMTGSIDISELAKGLYFIKAGNSNARFIKQ